MVGGEIFDEVGANEHDRYGGSRLLGKCGLLSKGYRDSL